MSKEEPRKFAATMRYAGLATQWIILLGLGVWGGMALDSRLHFKALFIIILPLLALAVALWQLIKTLNKDRNE